jgi:hypothetical protein
MTLRHLSMAPHPFAYLWPYFVWRRSRYTRRHRVYIECRGRQVSAEKDCFPPSSGHRCDGSLVVEVVPMDFTLGQPIVGVPKLIVRSLHHAPCAERRLPRRDQSHEIPRIRVFVSPRPSRGEAADGLIIAGRRPNRWHHLDMQNHRWTVRLCLITRFLNEV